MCPPGTWSPRQPRPRECEKRGIHVYSHPVTRPEPPEHSSSACAQTLSWSLFPCEAFDQLLFGPTSRPSDQPLGRSLNRATTIWHAWFRSVEPQVPWGALSSRLYTQATVFSALSPTVSALLSHWHPQVMRNSNQGGWDAPWNVKGIYHPAHLLWSRKPLVQL